MKSVLVMSALFTFAAFASSCASVHSSASTPAMSEAQMMEEMNTKWAAFATPGAAHQVLNERVGRWSLAVKMFMPGAPAPMESTGTNEVKWIMDGRYLQDTTTGESMGQTFSGLGTMGYDNLKQKYVGTWVDNMGTGIGVAEGTYDAATRTWTYACHNPDLMAGGYVPARSVERMVDHNHMVMQVFQAGPDGKEYMCMEISYTRI